MNVLQVCEAMFLCSLHNSMTMFNVSEVVPVTPEVPDLFVDMFNGEWKEGVKKEGKEAWLDLQLDIVHLMGALFSSSRKVSQHLMAGSSC